MKTKTYNLELILPDQLNKEVFFNENLGVIDSFCNNSIEAFVPSAPASTHKDKKFIITQGEHRNKICYATFPNKDWRYLTPTIGMTFFCYEQKNFTYFNGSEWIMQVVKSDMLPRNFESASGDAIIKDSFSYFYLNGQTKFIIENSGTSSITLIIKQNYSNIYDVSFDAPILWKNGRAYQSSRTPNKIDYVKLIKLPETSHYLCEVSSTGYSY